MSPQEGFLHPIWVAGLSFGGDAEASRSGPARVSRLRDKATAMISGIIPAQLANLPFANPEDLGLRKVRLKQPLAARMV
ncbi:hypothetical protein [Methyloceanibacter sp.]|uniref:hypothetical protein n=1 Tax=Methyloceanibacter sp. TaxID=1965321 RepID=UPI003D6C80F3